MSKVSKPNKRHVLRGNAVEAKIHMKTMKTINNNTVNEGWEQFYWGRTIFAFGALVWVMFCFYLWFAVNKEPTVKIMLSFVSLPLSFLSGFLLAFLVWILTKIKYAGCKISKKLVGHRDKKNFKFGLLIKTLCYGSIFWFCIILNSLTGSIETVDKVRTILIFFPLCIFSGFVIGFVELKYREKERDEDSKE